MLFYSFKHSFSICFQHALQISTCSEIFNTLSNMKIWNIYSQIELNPSQNIHKILVRTTLCIEGMKISKVEFWNSPMLWTIVLKTILKLSRHAENHVKNFKACWNIVFKMHYIFWHVLKFSFQHALQISEHSEIFKMLFQDVFNTFQT